MKLVVNRIAFSNAINLAGSAVVGRTPKPILQCLLLTAEPGSLTVEGTDLELSIIARIEGVEVDEPGKVAVPLDLIRGIFRESTEDTVKLELKTDGSLQVRTDSSQFKLWTQTAKDFPSLSVRELTDAAKITMPLATLQQQIEMTEFAIAKESVKYAFNGALFKLNGKFECVGTDGRRLAHSVVPLAETLTNEVSVIVPDKALNAALKIPLPKKKDEKAPEPTVDLLVTENHVRFVTENVTIGTNLVEGQFPPYESVIPAESDKKATIGREALTGALRRAALMITAESKGVRLKFSKKGVLISSRDPNSGEAEIHLPCKYEGEDLEIGMNPNFVLDGLKVIPEEDVTLEMQQPNRPGLFKAGDFKYVVMPVALQ